MIWKVYVLSFFLLQPWTRDQSESTNVSHSKTQFLAERNMRSNLSYFYLDLQTVLKFHKNEQTVNSQLKSQVNKHSDLKTLKK